VAKLLGVAVAQLMQNKISVFGHLESPSGYFLNSAHVGCSSIFN